MTVEPTDPLADPFEALRPHLRAVAYRMLGSLSEAEVAVQEAWLRLHRSDTGGVANLKAWLTTVVARVCLDMLRSRKARRETDLAPEGAEPVVRGGAGADPEREAVMAESVGMALLVVLDTLTPPERLAFVLHDLFGVPFDEIASIVGRSPVAVRQLASRARRRVRGGAEVTRADVRRQHEAVARLLAALRAGDVEAIVRVLDPDLVVRADSAASVTRTPSEVHGAETWARQAVAFARAVRFAEPALLDGRPGVILAPRGRLLRALTFTMKEGRIAGIEIIGDAERLRRLEIGVLEMPGTARE